MSSPALQGEPHRTGRGSPACRRIVIALFLSGYATFPLYCVQPLFSHHFRLDAARSALALSPATGLLAPSILLAGAITDRIGGKPVPAVLLYLLSYYLGSSLLDGLLWEQGVWNAVAAFRAGLLLLALLFAMPSPRSSARVRRSLLGAPVLLIATVGPGHARTLPSPFLQQMMRAELPNPAPVPDGMAPLSTPRVAGQPLLLGKTPIEELAHRLGVRVEHQGDAGDSVYWFCLRLDVPAGSRHTPRDSQALSLWLVSDAETAGPPDRGAFDKEGDKGVSHAISAIALDAASGEGRSCPVPTREADLTLDAQIARPGATTAAVAALYGTAPVVGGRSAYGLPGLQPDPSPLTLTVSMRDGHVETIWLAGTPDN